MDKIKKTKYIICELRLWQMAQAIKHDINNKLVGLEVECMFQVYEWLLKTKGVGYDDEISIVNEAKKGGYNSVFGEDIGIPDGFEFEYGSKQEMDHNKDIDDEDRKYNTLADQYFKKTKNVSLNDEDVELLECEKCHEINFVLSSDKTDDNMDWCIVICGNGICKAENVFKFTSSKIIKRIPVILDTTKLFGANGFRKIIDYILIKLRKMRNESNKIILRYIWYWSKLKSQHYVDYNKEQKEFLANPWCEPERMKASIQHIQFDHYCYHVQSQKI